MNDNISKVVKFLLGEDELRGAWFGDEPPGALGPMPRFWWRKDLRAAFARLESATTPAEVDGVLKSLRDARLYVTHAHCSITLPEGFVERYDAAISAVAALAHQLALVTESRDMAKGIIDALAAEMKAAGVALIDYKVVNTRADELARQLAEAKERIESLTTANELVTAAADERGRVTAEAMAVLRTLLSERNHRTDGALQELTARCLHLSRGDSDLIDMRGRLADDYKSDAEQAESQLAEATRMLGEVEGLLREALRGWDDVIEDLELNGLHDDPHFNYRRQKEWIGAVEAKAGAALTKEPTK